MSDELNQAGEVVVAPQKVSVEDATRALQEAAKSDVTACEGELTALLKKYNCGLSVSQQVLNGQFGRPEISVVKVPASQG